LVFCGQDFYVNGRLGISDSGYETVARACVASVDSVLDCKGWGLSFQSKGNFLYSATTTNSTMDNSAKTMEDGVVDSPPNRNAQLGRVSSPSPLKAKSTTQTRYLGSFGDSRSSRKLYNIPSSSSPSGVVKVFLRTSINFLYLSCYLLSWTCIEI
jgi:hypothetical protein